MLDIIELEKYFIMAIGFALAFIEFKMFLKTKRVQKIFYIIIGLFWGFFMLYSIVGLDPASESNMIIGRSGALLSLAIIFGNSLKNYRRLNDYR